MKGSLGSVGEDRGTDRATHSLVAMLQITMTLSRSALARCSPLGDHASSETG